MSVLVSNSCLLPTGGLRKCWFSAIQRWKLKALRRGCWSMADPFAGWRGRLFGCDDAGLARQPQATGFERRLGGGLLGVGELKERPAHRSADLAQQLLPVFLVSVGFEV